MAPEKNDFTDSDSDGSPASIGSPTVAISETDSSPVSVSTPEIIISETDASPASVGSNYVGILSEDDISPPSVLSESSIPPISIVHTESSEHPACVAPDAPVSKIPNETAAQNDAAISSDAIPIAPNDLDYRAYNYIHDPVLITSGEDIVYTNPSADRVLGSPAPGQLAGININDLLFAVDEQLFNDREIASTEVIRVRDIHNVIYEARQSILQLQNETRLIFILRKIPVMERMLTKFPESNPNAVVGIRLVDEESQTIELFLNNEALKRFPDFEATQLHDVLRSLFYVKTNQNKTVLKQIKVRDENGSRDYHRYVVYLEDEKMVLVYYSDITEMCKMAGFPEKNPNPIVMIGLEDSDGELRFRIDFCNLEACRQFPEVGLASKIKMKLSANSDIEKEMNEKVAFSLMLQGAEQHPMFSNLNPVIDYFIRESQKKDNRGQKTHSREIMVRSAAGEEKYYDQKFYYDVEKKSILMFFNDTTSLKTIEKEMEELNERLNNALAEAKEKSIRDPLTTAFNRRFLDEMMKRQASLALRKKLPLSVLMIDIDKFKKYNEVHGHLAADKVLVRVVQILSANIRKEDYVCRYGGEEFTVVLPLTNKEGMLVAAEKLRKAVSEHSPIEHNGALLPPVTISIGGVSKIPQFNEVSDTRKLIELADMALLKSKADGRNRVTVSSEAGVAFEPTEETFKAMRSSFPSAPPAAPARSPSYVDPRELEPSGEFQPAPPPKSVRLGSIPPRSTKSESKRLGSIYASLGQEFLTRRLQQSSTDNRQTTEDTKQEGADSQRGGEESQRGAADSQRGPVDSQHGVITRRGGEEILRGIAESQRSAAESQRGGVDSQYGVITRRGGEESQRSVVTRREGHGNLPGGLVTRRGVLGNIVSQKVPSVDLRGSTLSQRGLELSQRIPGPGLSGSSESRRGGVEIQRDTLTRRDGPGALGLKRGANVIIREEGIDDAKEDPDANLEGDYHQETGDPAEDLKTKP